MILVETSVLPDVLTVWAWELQKRLLKVPTGDLQCRVRGVNRRDTNSCVISYYQQGPGTIRDVCLNDLLCVSNS